MLINNIRYFINC